MAHDPRVHMAGLVVGIVVHPARGAAAPARGGARRLHLYVQEGRRRGRAARALGYVLQRGATPPAPDSVETGSSLLVLTRGEPTDIVVVNRLAETAAIHWHGIELESYSDGVAGWSGAGDHLAPSIEPGDSFVAHLTLPRAGTFIYHTHMNDLEQLTLGPLWRDRGARAGPAVRSSARPHLRGRLGQRAGPGPPAGQRRLPAACHSSWPPGWPIGSAS